MPDGQSIEERIRASREAIERAKRTICENEELLNRLMAEREARERRRREKDAE